MADAFTTVMSNLDTLRQKSVQYESDAKQINANTVGTIMEDGAKLAKTLYTQKVEEDMTKLQNYLNEEEAKGTFNWIGGIEENGVEYDPEGIYNNYVNAANTWISENSKGLSTLGLKKSANSYLEGLKASIYSNTRSSNYDAVQQNSKSSVAQLTSTSFDPLNENGLNLKVAAAYSDYSTIDDLSNVTTYGINEDVAKYKELMARYKDGTASEYDITQLADISFTIQFKLSSIIAGESDYYYENYTSKDFDDALMQFHVAQAVKAAASGVSDEYIKAGGDTDVITLAKYNFESDAKNNGLVIGKDENGNEIRITAAEMGDTVFNTAVTEYSNTLTIQAANALKVQTDALENATAAVKEDWSSLNGSLPYTSVDDYVEALMAKDGNLNKEYATTIVKQNATLVNEFTANAKAETARVAVEKYVSGVDDESLYVYLEENGLLFTASVTWGWGDLHTRKDDNLSFTTTYDDYKNGKNMSDDEIRVLLFRNSDTASTTGTSYPTNLFAEEEVYQADRSRAITKNIEKLTDLAIKTITDGAGTIDSLYEENGFDSKQNTEFTAVVNEIMADEKMSDYITAYPDAGREIVKAKWTMESSTASETEVEEATKAYNEYVAKAQVRANNEEYVTLAEKYLTASEEEKKEIEENAAEDGTITFITSLGEDTNLGSKIRKEAIVDGKIDRDKLADILNKWNGEATSLESSYKTEDGATTLERSQDYYAKRDWQAYSDALAKGAINGEEGVESELESAGFKLDDPNYNALQSLWKNLDPTIKRAIEKDKTGKTAQRVMNNLYGAVYGTVDEDDAEAVLTEIKNKQEVYESNERAFGILDVWIEPEAYTEEERKEAEREAVEEGLVDFLSNTLGMNSLTDLTDDDMSNEVRMAYEAMKAEAIAKGIEWDYDHAKNAILQILSDKNYSIEASRALTQSEIYDKAASYYTGKNTKVFSNEAVSLLSAGLTIEEVEKELEKKYPSSYNRKLYNTFFAYLKGDEELQKALVGADEDTINDVVAAVTNIVNSTDTSLSGQSYKMASESIISSLKTSYSNKQANIKIGKELAPLYDANATREDKIKAEQYMKDNNLYTLYENEEFKTFVQEYAKEKGISVSEAITYGLEDLGLDTFGKESFTGFTEDLTSENRVYNWTKSKTWDETQEANALNENYPAKKEELISVLSGNTVANVSFEDYADLQSVKDSIEGDEYLMEACSAKDSDGKNLYDVAAIVNAQYIINNYPDNTENKEAIKEAKAYIKQVQADVYLKNDYNLISLGYAFENGYDETKKTGYSDVYTKSLERQIYASMVDNNGQQTYENVLITLRKLDEAGISYDDFEKEWDSVTAEDVETMDWSTFYSLMSKLDKPLEKLARRRYSSFEYNYKDTESMSSVLYSEGATNEEVLGYEHDDSYAKMSDTALRDMVYATGLAAFGEDYEGWNPTDRLLETGAVGSPAYYDICSKVASATTEEERDNYINVEAPKVLTAEAIKEIKEMSSISLAVRQAEIPGYEEYDFWESVAKRAEGSTFATLEKADNLDDYKEMVGFSDVYNARIQEAVRDYENSTDKAAAAKQFGETLEEIELGTINSYFLEEIRKQQDYESREAGIASANSSLSTKKFNIISEFDTKTTSSTKTDKRQENANDFFDTFSSEVDQISAQCSTNDFDTESIIYEWANGTNYLSSDTENLLCGKLMDPDCKGKKRAGYMYQLGLELLGYPLDGLTPSSFDDDYDYASLTVYDAIEKLDEVDAIRLEKLVVNLYDKFDTLSTYNGLGYGTTYRLDVNGQIVDATYGETTKQNGTFIGTRDEQEVNLTLYSNQTKIGDKVNAVFDTYSKGGGIIDSNAFIKYNTPRDTAVLLCSTYNTEKSKAYSVKDYSTASEMAVDAAFYSQHELTSVTDYNRSSPYTTKWKVQEITGEEIAERYRKLIIAGDADAAIMYLSQFSEGMQKYVSHYVQYGNSSK